MPILNTLKSFIKSKRLAIKSFYFLSILLLVFISAIIMITNDYQQNASCNNVINTSSKYNSLKTFNSENKDDSSEEAETLKTFVFGYVYRN